MKKIKAKYGLLIIGVVTGIVYGLVARYIFDSMESMFSSTYFFIIPVILGMIPLMFVHKEQLTTFRTLIFIPWLAVIGFFIVAVLTGSEDTICLLILAAPFLILATLGSCLYLILRIYLKQRKEKLLSFMLLPFLLGPLEQMISRPVSEYTAVSEVVIAAAPDKIWKNIVAVKHIDESEYDAGFYNWAGIPRPVRATVDKWSMGGQRTGYFEDGLTFTENITEYRQNTMVAFSIVVEDGTVSDKIFQQHVLEGDYFKFKDATYDLNDLGNGKTRLTLSSRYTLTSTLNFYGHFWADTILIDFQDRLLDVVKKRCELLK